MSRGSQGGYEDRGYGGGSGGGYRSKDGGGGGGGGFKGGDDDDQEKTEFYVDQNNVGRIIGRQGSKIKELQSSTGCYIKIYSDQAEDGKVKISLSGDYESREDAMERIKDLDKPFDGERRDGGGGGGGRGGGGGYERRDNGRGDRGGGGNLTCYQCGGEGHFARDCQNSGGSRY